MNQWLGRAADIGLAGVEQTLLQVQNGLGNALRTARFLRGRGRFLSRSDDVYVVTYPRSGTTWLQFILHLLRERSCDFEHISQVAPWWERSMALGQTQPEDFEPLSSPRIFKSHLPRRWLPDEGRYIYIVRDGLDVAVSYHSLYRTHIGFNGSFEEFFELFMQGKLQYGSWFKHVEGWRQYANDPRVLLLKYEDILSDFDRVVQDICSFLEWPLTPMLLEKVRKQADFTSMKACESQFDPITETLLHQGLKRGQFIRQGQAGGGRAVVTDEIRKRFDGGLVVPPRCPELELDIPAFLH